MDISKTEQAKISPSKGLLNPAMPRKRLPSTRSKAKSSRRARRHHPGVELRAQPFLGLRAACCRFPARAACCLKPTPFRSKPHPDPPRSDGFQPSPSSPKNKARPTEPQKAQPCLRLVPAFQLRRSRTASLHQSAPDTTAEMFLTWTFQVGTLTPHENSWTKSALPGGF